MKRVLTFGVLAMAVLVTLASFTQDKDKKKGKNKKNKTEEVQMEINLDDTLTKVSYALGMNIVENLKQQGLDTIDEVAFAQGVKQAMEGDSTLITSQEAVQVLQTYFGELQEKKAKEAAKEGEKFLAENGKREGVVTTASGLQYEVLTAAEGPKPSATSEVTVHYTGTLIDGTKFDSSVDRGQPATFPLNQVIRGWTEGLQLMSVGSKYKFYIPYDLGYGPRGQGGTIPPYAVLVFEVELLNIK